MLEDNQIIDLLFARKGEGLEALEEKYKRRCLAISQNILNSPRDAEECVSDAYFQVWSTIPPTRPDSLSCYLYTLVRRCSCLRYHQNKAQKRNSLYDVALEELEDCLPCDKGVEDALEARALSSALNGFLATLKKEDRSFFIRRYWCAQSVLQIGQAYGKKPHFVSVRLDRTRKKLKKYLIERGFTV